ncbi:Hypothetical protein EPM1_3240 [Stenotrophomonas maltophilia EPM1]|nr:Hypothetical protein EPM1_3240 [Stenotrophomonas maltophilia EPM1]
MRVDRTTTAARAETFAMTRPAVQHGPPASPGSGGAAPV